jgi:diguanylate cyclase (GGDEF)-like protein/PAS domain S-box-containing protein
MRSLHHAERYTRTRRDCSSGELLAELPGDKEQSLPGDKKWTIRRDASHVGSGSRAWPSSAKVGVAYQGVRQTADDRHVTKEVGTGDPEDAEPTCCRLVRNEAALITAVDESVADILGWQPAQLIGRPSTDFIHPDDQASAVAAWFAMIGAPGSTRAWRGRYRTNDGGWRWIEAVNTNRLDDPVHPAILTDMRPATMSEMTLEEQLRAREELFARLTEALPVGVFQFGHDRAVLFTNGRLHRILGSPPANDVGGLFAAVVPEDRGHLDSAVDSVLAGHEITDLELRYGVSVPHPDFAATRVCQVSFRPLTDGAGTVTGAIGCLSDVTDSVELRRELTMRAATDGLTGCLNRTATFELLDREMRAPRFGGLAVIFIDLNHFKSINDEFGHAAGDQALLCAVDKIRSAIRAGDALGRIGGDEFLVVCPAIPSPEAVLPKAQRISEMVRGPVETTRGAVHLSASLGIAWTDERGASPDELIARADAAMYQSKVEGGVVLASVRD